MSYTGLGARTLLIHCRDYLHRKFEPDNHQRSTEEYVRFVAVSATPTALTTGDIETSAGDEELR